MPTNDGWYWILLDGYYDSGSGTTRWVPAWYSEDGGYFLPGGMGDSSSCGLFADDVVKVGPEIIEPKF